MAAQGVVISSFNEKSRNPGNQVLTKHNPNGVVLNAINRTTPLGFLRFLVTRYPGLRPPPADSTLGWLRTTPIGVGS